MTENDPGTNSPPLLSTRYKRKVPLEDGVPESELDIVATGNDSDLSDSDVFDRNETSPDIPTGFHVDGPSTSATQQSPSGSQQTLQTIQITLRRHQSSGFGFRPASGVGPEPIVASVIQGKSSISAFRVTLGSFTFIIYTTT